MKSEMATRGDPCFIMEAMRFLLLLLPALLPAQTPAPHKTSAPGHKAVTAAPVTNFKESGSPDAPVTIDLYTDYQCPSCRVFYLDKLPALINDFVQTGKVRLIHRDFPLPMHQFGPPITLHIVEPFYVGIGFCSHLPDKLDTAVLSNVVLENSAGKMR